MRLYMENLLLASPQTHEFNNKWYNKKINTDTTVYKTKRR